jgi:hypothetical protein
VEKFNAAMEKRTNSDTHDWVMRNLSESYVPAEPLLHQRRKEPTRETEAETEEPKYVHVDESTLRPKRFEVRRRKSIANGEPSEFLGDLCKKPRRHFGGIRLEVLVAFDKECSDCRGEYACLDSITPNVSVVSDLGELF